MPSSTTTPRPSRVAGWFQRLPSHASNSVLWVVIGVFVVWSAFFRPEQLVIGIAVGSVFALGALGLTLIYGILKFAHFAHGDSMMLAAYFSYFFLSGRVFGTRSDVQLPWGLQGLPGATTPMLGFSFGYGLLLAILFATASLIVVFLMLDRLVYRPLRDRRAGIVIFAIASLGIAIAIRSVMLIFWGPTPRLYVTGIRPTIELPFGPRIVTDQLFIVLAAGILCLLVYLVLYRTRIGKAMRAMADNPDLARVSGIDTRAVVRWTWILAALLVTVAGTLLGLQAQLRPELGFVLLLPLFAAAILGGIGSPQGALVGGLIVGIVEEVAVSLGMLSPGYKFAVAFIILIIMILVRPRGLFGVRT
jgi:branched-chain amino acid transport system permease protein